MSENKYIIEGEIDIAPLLSAYEQFSTALRIAKSDLEKAGTIQYFEFTYELCWKTLKRVLKARGKDVNSPKPVFRDAAVEGLISNPEAWFSFMTDRNETVHTYNKSKAEQIFSHLSGFNDEAQSLIETLKKLK